MGQINKTNSFELSAGNAKVFGEISEKLKNNKKMAALGTTPLALVLSACGGSETSTTASNVLTLTKSADTYSASAVTGFAVTDSSTAKFAVADAASNAYEIKLDATGTGVLEFDFVDAGDTVTLAAGSKSSGFTTLKVTDGTLDATNADLTGITRVEVASGIKISLAQIKDIPTFVANSATSEITVEVASEAELTELSSLITAGTVKIFADTNPVKLVAAPTATISTEVLATKQAETTAAIKPTTEAPADTAATDTTTTPTTGTDTDTDTDTDTGSTGGGGAPVIGGSPSTVPVTHSGSGNYVVGTDSGPLTLTTSGAQLMVTPTVGAATGVTKANVVDLRSDVALSATADVIEGFTLSGSGAATITAAAGAQTITIGTTGTGSITTGAGADTVTVTSTGGTQTVNVTSEASTTNTVNFTGTGSTNVINVTGSTAGTTVDASGSTKDFALTGAAGITMKSVNANINGEAYTGAVDYEVTNTAAAAVKIGTAATSIKALGADSSVALTVDADAAGGTAGALTIKDAGAVAGDITVTGIESNVTIANAFTGTGDISLTTADASMTLALGTSTTGTRALDLSASGAAKTVTLTGSDAVAVTSATTDINAEAYAGAVTAELTNTDDMTFKVGTAATSIAVKGANGAKTVTIDADAGSGTAGALTIANGGAVAGDIAVTGLEAGITISDAFVGTGDVSVTLGATTGQTVALGTSTTGTRAVVADALTDTQSVTLTGSDAATVGLVAGDLNAAAYAGALTITATTGTNVIVGGTAGDTIIGGDAVDSLTGGLGADVFVFDADDSASVGVANNLSTGSDTIADFSIAGGDKIKITGELTHSFDIATHVVLGESAGGTASGLDVAIEADFADDIYLVARDADVTDGFDTAVNVFSTGSTAAFDTDAKAQAATVFDVTLAAGGNTIVLGANDDKLVGGSGADVVTGGAGVDNLSGLAGTDKFIIGTSDDAVGETYTGGDDSDTLDVNAAANLSDDTIATMEVLDLDAGVNSAVAVTMTAAQLGGFTNVIGAASAVDTGDVITLTTAIAADTLDTTVLGASSTSSVAIKLADAVNAITLVDASLDGSADKLFLDGSALTGTNALTFDGSAETSTATMTVVGGAAADSITTSVGADTVNAGGGADTINLGGDTSVTDTVSIARGDSADGAEDTILNFKTADDKIILTGDHQATSINLGALTVATGEYQLGDDDVKIYSNAGASPTALTATDLTANIQLGTSAAAYVTTGDVTGGAFADFITGGAGAQTLIGGAGDDIITVTEEASVAGAVTGGADTDKLVVTGSIDHSGAIAVNLVVSTSDQIDTVSNFFSGNQTGIENFDFSGVTFANVTGIEYSGFTTANTVITGSAAVTDTLKSVANSSDLTGSTLRNIDTVTFVNTGAAVTFDADNFTNVTAITGTNGQADTAKFKDDLNLTTVVNTEIQTLNLLNGVDLTIDAANLTGVTAITGTSGDDNETIILKEAAAFDMKAITSMANIASINMANADATATGVTLLVDASNNLTGTLVGKSGTAQTLTVKGASNNANITTITNTNVETIALFTDDDDLTIDVANLTDVTAINGVNAGNAEYVIATGASTFDFSAVTLTDIGIKGTASAIQTIITAKGGNEIDLVGTGAADIIKYTFTDKASAAAEVGSTAGTDTDYAATLGSEVGDTIKSFTSGTDKIHIAAAAVTNALGSEADTLKTIAASGTVANTDRFVEITTAQSNSGDMGAAITLLDGLTTSAVAVGDSFVASVVDGSNTTLYLVEQVSTADTIAAQDVTLLLQLTGVTDLADGDFVTF